MTLLSRMIANFKSALKSEPCPHWADYLNGASKK